MGSGLTRPTQAEANVPLRRIAAGWRLQQSTDMSLDDPAGIGSPPTTGSVGLLRPLHHKRARHALPGRRRLTDVVGAMIEACLREAAWVAVRPAARIPAAVLGVTDSLTPRLGFCGGSLAAELAYLCDEFLPLQTQA